MAKVSMMANNYGIIFTTNGDWTPLPFSTNFVRFNVDQVDENRRGIWLRMSLYIDRLDKKDSRDLTNGRIDADHMQKLRAYRVRFFNWAVKIGAPNIDSIHGNMDCNRLRDSFKRLLNRKSKGTMV